jgi:Hemerythrin HHE cation binding domain
MPAAAKDAIALLKADHRKVEKLFDQYAKAKRVEKKRTLARQICTELLVHTKIEEEILYPACRGEIKDATVDEAFVEHDGAKVLVAEVEAGDPSDAFYDAKVKVLGEDVRHHIKEEERPGGLFSQARKAGLDLDALGKELKARKKALLQQIEADGLPKPKTSTLNEVQIRGAKAGRGAKADDGKRQEGRSYLEDEGPKATVSAN